MKPDQKEKAREMRSKMGLSLREISESLRVSKGTVSLWVRDIELTNEQKNRFVENAKETRKKFLNEIMEKTLRRHNGFRELGYALAKKDEKFRLFCSLYWAEGWKDRNVFDFANCDVDMLRCVCSWLVKNNYGTNIHLKIRYYEENGIKEKDIINWWMSNLKCIDRSMVSAYSFKIKRETQKKGIGKRMYGVASINVFDTELIQRVQGGIEYLKVFMGK